MRLDVFSIFPQYLQPLELSLIGKARANGLLDLRVHDLRDWTHDRHRSVDDAPYGGGAGMVMRPEPWGNALAWLLQPQQCAEANEGAAPHLIVPSPSGEVFSQHVAKDLAAEPWLAFACGRYEGIDERVLDEARSLMKVSVVSLGDYVLNGGEVAALAIIEAVARLVPGVIGNDASLLEESHVDGLLEYPVYTKPAQWQGREVPEVLRSGDHGAIKSWRTSQALSRTAQRRPDLLAAASAKDFRLDDDDPAGKEAGNLKIAAATDADAGEILTLSLACWVPEGRAHDSFAIPALNETLEGVRAAVDQWPTWVLRRDGRLVGSVRARRAGEHWDIGRLMVAPDLQGLGLGRSLLRYAEQTAPADISGFVLFTGASSEANLRMYTKAGYQLLQRSEYQGVPTMELYKPNL